MMIAITPTARNPGISRTVCSNPISAPSKSATSMTKLFSSALQALNAIGMVGGVIVPIAGQWLEQRGIDDAVGAWAVHGVAGFWGVLVAGIFAWGYPNAGDAPAVSLIGQFVGAVVCAAMGFIPGYVASLALKSVDLLRVPDAIQVMGLDKVKVPSRSYPEFMAPAE